ncbi:unnamed protein product [Blepharisma stoltei]|uniref:Vacuolar protein sorting-associated protein 35 n=1 Tax=Blepharisma stoltei TaxID=1481888 RepID=A0AAU9IZA5_9CILI|nr:unnamed protein product [Blepharisma stoltei]
MDEEQQKYLDDAIAVVKQEAYEMHQALDSSNLKEALKHANNMISELKTSLLSPKTYYELYMQIFDELNKLETYFLDAQRKGRSMMSLYEKVQQTPAVLPRIYLLITVGSACIQTKEATAKEILRDLIEMVKGVQFPIRGLFLRYYLNKLCKDKLPDSDSDLDEQDGTVADSVDFLLANLAEMNKLWIRLQNTANTQEKSKREKERNDLRVTVGENINRLSSLQGVNQELYQTSVLPKILEVITSSKDPISQQYLMDCIIQAFPDAFHLHTLSTLLQAFSELQPSVDINSILVNLLTRLSEFIGESEIGIANEVDIFGLIEAHLNKIIENPSSDLKKLLQLQVSFLSFTIKCYPKSTDHVNTILNSCVNIIAKNCPDKKVDADSVKHIVKLLSIPLETLSLAILSMNHYPELLSYLAFSARKQVSFKIVKAAISCRKILDSLSVVNELFDFATPLWACDSDEDDIDDYEFEEEQQNMAKLVHLVKSQSLDATFKILEVFKKNFSSGGDNRIKFTFPALFFAYAKLLPFADSNNDINAIDSILKIMAEIIKKIFKIDPESSLKYHLQCMQAINSLKSKAEFEQYAFEFVSQAFRVYFDEFANSRSKFSAISMIAGTLVGSNCFEEENFDTLVFKCTQFSARQLKKADQCKGVAICTHLFYNKYYQNEVRVLECLNRAAKTASICIFNPKNVFLFVVLLNTYIYYHNLGVDSIGSSSINKIIQLIKDQLESIENGHEEIFDTDEIKTYYFNTIKYIRARQLEDKLVGIII